MQHYSNSTGRSNILSYEIGADFIIVQFKDYKQYKYSHHRAGSSNVDQMKKLAIQGWGLNTFISKYVRKLYDI